MLPNLDELNKKKKTVEQEEKERASLPSLDFLEKSSPQENKDLTDEIEDIENQEDGGFEIEAIEDDAEIENLDGYASEIIDADEELDIDEALEELPIEDEIDAFLPTENDFLPTDDSFMSEEEDLLPIDDSTMIEDAPGKSKEDLYSADEKVGELLNNIKDKLTNISGSGLYLKKLIPIAITVIIALLLLKFGLNLKSSKSVVVKSDLGAVEIKEHTLGENSIEVLLKNIEEESFDGELYATISTNKIIGSEEIAICESGILAIEPGEEAEVVLSCNEELSEDSKVKFELEDIY